MWTIPTMYCSLQSAYVTWNFGLATISAGTLVWDLRYAKEPASCLRPDVKCFSKKIVCIPYMPHLNLNYTHTCVFPPWSGTCSPALQGATGKARRAAKKSGRVTARGDQSLCLIFLWTAGLPNALHHSSADFCLTERDSRGVLRTRILPVRRGHCSRPH